MSATVVWMDHQHAKLFHLAAGGQMKTQELANSTQEHHTRSHKEDRHASDGFFHQVISALSSSSEVLLMGPGTAKTEFQHHLEKHGHAAIAKKIIAVETVDHPSEKQILELARKTFKAKDLFNHPIG